MLSINWSDVVNVMSGIKYYLVAIAIILLAAIIFTVFFRKHDKSKRHFERITAWLAALLAVIVTVNLIMTGPLNSMISLAMSGGRISDQMAAESQDLCETIAEEGIVLLKNDGLLPIAAGNINLFGWASTNPVYGGTGSGSISDDYPKVNIVDGLTNAGFTLNQDLLDFYTSYRAERPELGMFAQDWTLPEPPADQYADSLINDAKSFSDLAVLVISRAGGEGYDLPTRMGDVTFSSNSDSYNDFEADDYYLKLSKSEKNLLDLVCAEFKKVVVIYNGANTMELGWVADYPSIKSVIWCPGAGQSGFNALGSILNGSVNPSGKTTDTFVADLSQTPTFNNFGNFTYDNMEEFPADEWGNPSTATFVNYVENIYVGYRFYETAAVEGLIDYDSTVVYPFGYGLSYTTFDQKMSDLHITDQEISFDVTVTNTGDQAGKDVVEVYYDPPYTNGGIEKASANLIAFDKTDLLEPGASQTIPVSFKAEDLASYDYSGAGAYVLEAGDYGISIRTSSHDIIDQKTYTVEKMLVYDQDNGRSTDLIAAVNHFDAAAGDVSYLSRKDGFKNYKEATAAPASLSMPDAYKATFINNSNYDFNDYNDPSDEMPVTGAGNGKKLSELRGLAYDDPEWESLLDQLTVAEMNTMISLGGFQTAAAKSVGKIQTIDCDGPASINNNFTGYGSIGFPSATMVASTWNTDIALQFGESIGKMADEMGVSGWYAPAMNIHRNAFAGRNYEYYSEDGYLSGRMAASAVIGAEEYGVYGYIKHFAMNDQETNRNRMICTWSTEQAMREIYFKPFEIAVKEGKAKAVMSSFAYIGTRYAAAMPELLQTVLREEWGFRGLVETDYFGVYGYQNADQEIRAGNDLMLVAYDTGANNVADQTSATSIKAMRQACHNIMYTAVNSRAYDPEKYKEGLQSWQKLLIAADVILAGLIVLLWLSVYKKYKQK